MKQHSNNLFSGPSMIQPVNISKPVRNGGFGVLSGSSTCNTSSDASLFSSSLPVLPHEKLTLDETDHGLQSAGDTSAGVDKLKPNVESTDLLQNGEAHVTGALLPDDEDELLAGIMDDFDLSRLPGSLEDLDDNDLFGSGGGMELETDLQETLSFGISKVNLSDAGNGMPQYGLPSGVGTVAGEHPYGEHPSRTLFVRNINSNVEDSELKALFEQYGDVRTLYTACKHRGFVMISYYDIRAARTAMRALQNKPLRRRKLDIHFSIPKDNPSDKDINQGTLVVFNLDPSVSNEDLRQIFGAYGEVKEIRETPHKRHHKFIEYYDVRAAEAALKQLNRSDIAGKRIKLEPSRPGGARRNLMLQLNQELEQDEPRSFLHPVGSPVTNSPPGNWIQFSSPMEPNPLQSFSKSPGFSTMSPTNNGHVSGLASILHPQVSSAVNVAPIGRDHGRTGFQQSHSLPDSKLSQYHASMSSLGPSTSNGSAIETLTGPQFLWGSPKTHSEKNTISSAWPAPSTRHPFPSNGKGRHGSFLGAQQHHHVGSAPSGIPLERHLGFLPESPKSSFMNPASYGGISMGHNDGSFMMNMENGSSSYRMMSSPRLSPVFLGSSPYAGLSSSSMDGFSDRGRIRRVENNGSQGDSKKQFQLDLDKIMRGEDTRTTLMIKNIPNKYTSKMLLAAIDEKHRGTYDFIYLPIDFKNKCNVGYAFINMVSPSHIIPFYEAFNGKKWEKFNSEKVASLAYARIQGKTALVNHFQNSSLMNEDKRCRPILFRSDGQELVDQVEFQLPYFFVVALSPQFSLQSSSRSKFSVHLSFIDHSRPSTLQQFEHSVPSAKWVTLWGFVRKPHRRLLPRRMLTVKGTSGCALLPAPY
ncbi:Protein MEI2-like 5 [Linum perenne]